MIIKRKLYSKAGNYLAGAGIGAALGSIAGGKIGRGIDKLKDNKNFNPDSEREYLERAIRELKEQEKEQEKTLKSLKKDYPNDWQDILDQEDDPKSTREQRSAIESDLKLLKQNPEEYKKKYVGKRGGKSESIGSQAGLVLGTAAGLLVANKLRK